MNNESGKIKITWADVEKNQATEAPLPVVRPVQAAEKKDWGTVASTSTSASVDEGGGGIWLKGWFYLGLAGLVSAFLAWAICEPSFFDYDYTGWGNYFLFPLMLIFMSIGFGTVESIVERTWTRAITRGLASIGLGLIFGIALSRLADLLYGALQFFIIQMGADESKLLSNPVQWIVRGIAWAVFGIAGGLVFGIVSKSGKKTASGIWGGMLGAGIGGMLFDPITLLSGAAEPSRAIGMSILGCVSGISIGLVESAMKERWLYVTGGPLAGKQFVLYQDKTIIGKSQTSTIYLFKDPSIQETHAVIEKRGVHTFITANGPTVVSGVNLQLGVARLLRSGDVIQVGRYTFTYSEKTGD
ncbi:MAG TPA: FHA domain-containing protein [Kiritimatiellia bacterium]|nr:FHA domain-containing protein [Kiritimatiellia bacterium]HMP35026.1 FHA domain-containing protein [Kiritimatiellia bacterium]